MLTLPPSTRIFLATHPSDMRRSFDGLLALVRDFLGHQDPLSGHLFVFRNKCGDRLKVIWWDRDGLAIFYKRLEIGSFTLPAVPADTRQIEMTAADLQLVLQGIDPAKVHRSKRYSRPHQRPLPTRLCRMTSTLSNARSANCSIPSRCELSESQLLQSKFKASLWRNARHTRGSMVELV